jgi:lysozyme
MRRGVPRAIMPPLKQTEFDALVSFTFNCGEGSLRRSSLRRRLNAGNRSAVRSELMKWVYSGGKKLPGLVRRRQAKSVR